jgi:hypothetical protein
MDEARPPKKKKKKKARPAERAAPAIAVALLPPWLSYGAIGAAAIYLLLVFADASGWQWLGNHFPRPLHYFGQVAALFPQADAVSTDFYAEGWSCREQRWTELDLRPYFQIDADEKENRFGRATGFYSKGAKTDIRNVMQALDEYITPRVNDARRSGGGGELVGGIRILRAAIPLPKFGERIDRYFRRKLVDMPSGWKRVLFYTRPSKRTERCKGFDPAYDANGLGDDDERGVKRAPTSPHEAPEAAPAEAEP